NLIERTLLFSDGPRIRATDLPNHLLSPTRGVFTASPATGAPSESRPPSGGGEPVADGLKERVRQRMAVMERDEIVKALEETGGNVSQAAKLLKISRKTLQTKMKEFGLRDADAD